MSDFITKYVNFLSGITDAPKPFLEACALFLVSVGVGREWTFKSLPDSAVFTNQQGNSGRLLNLWLIFIGKSRTSRKSTVLKHVKELCEKVFGKHIGLSQAFTPESLLKEMSDKSQISATESKNTVCFWISDEIAWFFQQLRKKSTYMATTDAFLSQIYDGNTYSRNTIQRGVETVWNPYLVCILASTDYLPSLFDPMQIRLGFLNRFIFIFGERESRKPLRTKPLTTSEMQEKADIESFLKAIADRNTKTFLEMTDDAKLLYDSFEEEIENRIENEELGIKESYLGQLPNPTVRLSCLYRISRMTISEIKQHGNSTIVVERQDVKEAIDYTWRAWDWFGTIIELMNESKGKKTLGGYLSRRGYETVLEKLKKGHSTRKELLVEVKAVGCSSSLLDNQILPKLCKSGIIKRGQHGSYSLNEMSDERGRLFD